MKFVLFSAASFTPVRPRALFRRRSWGFAETPGTTPCGFSKRGERRGISGRIMLTLRFVRHCRDCRENNESLQELLIRTFGVSWGGKHSNIREPGNTPGLE